MTPDRTQIVEREREMGPRCGLAAILGALIGFAGFILLRTALKGDANFEGLTEAHDNASTIWLSGAATALGFLLLVPALLLLFKAARARSERVRNQLIGVVILGPVLLGLSGLLFAGGTVEAADNYVDGKSRPALTAAEAKEECASERKDDGKEQFAEDFPAGPGQTALAACEDKKLEEDTASEAIRDANLVGLGQLAGIAGGLALVIGLFYTGLWSLRTGLLTRFWGSLGMAVGIAALLGLTPFLFVWFVYLGVLLMNKIPGGKPPAWDAGEAIPWPTPGEKAAAELDTASSPEAPETSETGERRKRKQRDEGQSE